jgi:hypothetical protein
MAQAVSRLPLIAEAQIRARVNPCGICGGQSGTGTGFPQSSSVSPVNIIPPSLSNSYHLGYENRSASVSGRSSEMQSYPIKSIIQPVICNSEM